jgi:WD40 repeat protein
VFLAEVNGLEVVRDNQKTSELSTSFTPSVLDAHGSLVAVGGEVCCFSHSCTMPAIDGGDTQDAKVRLYNWDGKSLKEAGLLEGNKGPISAVRFSPDGTMVVSGDVSRANCFHFIKLIQSSRRENSSYLMSRGKRWDFHRTRSSPTDCSSS